MEKNNVPIWEKYSLSIAEAAQYFGIGEKRLRQIVAENPRAGYRDLILCHGVTANMP